MIQTWLRFAIRRTPLYGGLRYFRDRSAEQAWLRQPHATGAAPHRIKVRTLREHAQRYGIRTLIETGTLYGDTIWRVRNDFDRIVSIEIDPTLSANARRRFKSDQHIEFVVGDSGVMLQEVLKNTSERCLFWLDGHYSGEHTGRGELDSPIVNEIKHILSHHVPDHVILVDDAREFVGVGGYPTIDEFRRAILRERPTWSFSVADDIVRITPPLDEARTSSSPRRGAVTE
jgi:hypothetical protein